MDNIENNINAGFDLPLIKAFLDSCENQNRFNISVISSICLELAEAGEDCNERFCRDCAQRIISQCSQIMKLTEIYSLLSDFIDEEKFVSLHIDISSYLKSFVFECNEVLNNTCSLTFMGGTNMSTDVIKRLLEFILVMYVRRAVLFGAEKIEISQSCENDKIIISMEITKKTESLRFNNIPEVFSVDFSEGILRTAAFKMNGEYFVDDNGMKLVFPVSKSESTKLNSALVSHGRPIFSTINNILSDLGNISLI